MTQDLEIARERMKRRLNSVRAKTGYAFREPVKVLTQPSAATERKERINDSLRKRARGQAK